MTIECDVLVIGSGPSGSSAARSASLKGAKVIFVEKRDKPGKIECGEAIGSYLIPFLPFKIPKNQLIWKTTGMSFDSENIHLERYGKLWKAYSINREKFDNWIAQEAVKSGAELFCKTELTDIDHEDGYVKKAFLKKDKENIEIKPKVIIAADGTESTTLKLLGKYKPKKDDVAEILSYEYKNVDISNPNVEQIFLGDYIDGGYGYIFPKSNNQINIGVGSIYKQDLHKSFEEFCQLPTVKKQIKKGKNIREKSGKAPVIPYLEKIYFKNVLVTGDAACQNFKPYAEGILPGITCGNICGSNAVELFTKKIDLKKYDKDIEKKIGFLFKESDKITKTIYDLFLMKDRKKYLILIGYASNYFLYTEIEELKNKTHSEINEILIKRAKNNSMLRYKEDLQVMMMRIKGIFS
jgi:digeranylgeranylglycerophospholipid reductase